MTASQPARTASSSGRTSRSNVSREARFEGQDSAAIGVTASAPSRAATSRNAAKGEFVPASARFASSPYTGPLPWPNDSYGVGIGEKVFVSCLTWAMTKRLGMRAPFPT
jgi:hypothetical protein